MEMKFLGVILNKTKEDRIRNTDIRLELGVDERKNYIQKKLRWFGHVVRMGEERISKKILHTKLEGNDRDENPESDGENKLERIYK